MLSKVRGTILGIHVLPEFEGDYDQEIDIFLECGPTVEMCVTEDIVELLRNSTNKEAEFEITDRSPCGNCARAINFEINEHND